MNAIPRKKPKLTFEEFVFMWRMWAGKNPSLSDSLKRALDEVLAGPDFQGLDQAKAWRKALLFLAKNRPEVFTDKIDDRVALKTTTAMLDDEGEPRKEPLLERISLPDCTITAREISIAARKRTR